MDITYYYNDWIAIGNIIKNMFDEEGRALFHKVSSFIPIMTMMKLIVNIPL